MLTEYPVGRLPPTAPSAVAEPMFLLYCGPFRNIGTAPALFLLFPPTVVRSISYSSPLFPTVPYCTLSTNVGRTVLFWPPPSRISLLLRLALSYCCPFSFSLWSFHSFHSYCGPHFLSLETNPTTHTYTPHSSAPLFHRLSTQTGSLMRLSLHRFLLFEYAWGRVCVSFACKCYSGLCTV